MDVKALLKKINIDPLAIKTVNLTIYPDDTIPNELRLCKNLKTLRLNGNVTEIPSFLEELPMLERLDFIVFEDIFTFPKNLSKYKNLKTLAADCCSEKDVLSCLQLTNLENLTLLGESIKHLPSKIENLVNLKELYLLATSITELPTEITNLKKLKTVRISQGYGENIVTINTKQIIDVLADCKNIQTLDLKHCKIDDIPLNIVKLKTLKLLSFNDNLLTEIPSEIFTLENLTELDLGVNRLHKIPKNISNLKKLKTLKLNSNWMNKLDVKNLMNEMHLLENLEVLHLWSCQSIKEIPESISQCKKLKELDLDNNPLEKIPESIYEMKWLKKLRLTVNDSDSIKEKLIVALPQTKLSITENRRN